MTPGAALAANERGSVLIIAVIAMLILGVLGVSFALLANIETTIGFNYKQQAQAEALAESALEQARDALRTAATEPCGFTRWTSTTAVTGCGSVLGQTLFSAVNPPAFSDASSTYWYSGKVVNDCTPYVPSGIADGNCGGGTPDTDANETAVVTAWASAGSGKAQVRAILTIDDVWKHVCSDSVNDPGGPLCNDPANTNGTPTINPSDPNDPHGPKGWSSLPIPTLGCSQIDPSMHGGTSTSGTCGTGRQVVAGGSSGAATINNCNGPNSATDAYSGYFDCALTTPCSPAGNCPGGTARNACIRATDSRVGTSGYTAVNANGKCPNGATGMVFNYYDDGAGGSLGRSADGTTQNPDFNGFDVGDNGGGLLNAGNGRNVYVLNRPASGGGYAHIKSGTVYGTMVVEGGGTAGCTGSDRDVYLENNGTLTTKQRNTTAPAAAGPVYQGVYGYPLALVVYDPLQAVPTSSPYAPQNTCADMGSNNTLVNGLVYSGGEVQFNPISLNGGVVGFDLQTQGGNNASYSYNNTYGNAAPPGGFAAGSGTEVVISRKSFVVCATYSSGGASCN